MSEETEKHTSGVAVRDVMQHQVITVEPDLTVRELAQRLLDHGISGAPVVDEAGRAVGVVSATDVMRAASGEEEARRHPAPGGFYRDEERTAEPGGRFVTRLRDDDRLDHILVEDIMTPATFSVRPSTPVERLAGVLRDLRLHRALVVEDGRLVGIVSSLDVLDVVAGDAETATASWEQSEPPTS